jgi:hypothetical protein
MTRVVPPRESMPSEAAFLRRSKPSFFRWSVLRSGVLRAASILLLAQAAMAWLQVFGAGTTDFLTRQQPEQIMIGATAIIATIAGVGLWMLALWGVALWVVCLGIEIGPLAMHIPWDQLVSSIMPNRLLAVSIGLFVLFILSALLSAVEAGRSGRG